MMASDFAPTFLSPVGYGIIELLRLPIDFQVQAFTMSHPLRWALVLNHPQGYPCWRYRFVSDSLSDGDTFNGAKALL
jgi:hypothetical protein